MPARWPEPELETLAGSAVDSVLLAVVAAAVVAAVVVAVAVIFVCL